MAVAVLAAVLLAGALSWARTRPDPLPPDPSPPDASPAGPTSEPSSPAGPTSEPSSAAGPTSGSPASASTDAGAGPTRPPAPSGEPVDLGGLVGQVSAVRDLSVLRPLDVRRLDDTQMADLVGELAFADVDPVELEHNRQLLVSLRLLEPDQDLRQLLESLYRGAVVGLYVPEDERLYVRSASERLSPYGRFTAAHEVTHALQDQHHDLEALRDLPVGEDDAELALLALVEGDAVVTQQAWALRHQSAGERAALGSEALLLAAGTPADLPRYLRRSVELPYAQGAAFVAAVMGARGADTRAQLYANPPTTTEQVLHPERYLAGEQAVDVRVPEALGTAAWTAASTTTVGEFDVVELLWSLGSGRATAAGAGWGGGRARLWRRGEDTATSLALEFDTPADAAEACAALADWYGEVADGAAIQEGVYAGDRDLMALACGVTSVRMGLGGDPDTAVAARGVPAR